MTAFRYEALDSAGHTVSGMVLADTARQARAQLRAQGLLPSQIDRAQASERARRLWARGLSSADLSLLTRQLATLLQSGLTMERALEALIEEAAEPLARETLIGVKSEVSGGSSLAGALGAYPNSFPDFYRALVHGGEESGALPNVLEQLADYLDARQALIQKTTLALIYPALVSGVAALIVTGLLVYVVPQVVDVFQQSRQSLPVLTRGLIGLSHFLRDAWPFLLVLAVGSVVAARLALRRESVRRSWHALILRLPWLGSLARSVNTARFASTLAILVTGGVPLLAALTSCAGAMSNLVMRDAIERAIERVREGTSLARALADGHVFPPLLVHLVASGEASGKLDQMLDRAARLQTQSLERRLAVFLTVLEPAMVLLLGGMVLLIVLAILLPIIQINQLVR